MEKLEIVEIDKAYYEIDKVIHWRLSGETLASSLVDMASVDIDIPDEALGKWLGEVDRDDYNFIVTLYYHKEVNG